VDTKRVTDCSIGVAAQNALATSPKRCLDFPFEIYFYMPELKVNLVLDYFIEINYHVPSDVGVGRRLLSRMRRGRSPCVPILQVAQLQPYWTTARLTHQAH